MKKNTIILLFISALLFSLNSCKKESDDIVTTTPTTNNLVKLSEGYAVGAATKVQVWGKKNYFAGYNNLTVILLDSANPSKKITDAHVTLMPMMDMGMMQHACPVENPSETAVESAFPGAVVFIMPTSGSGTWKLGVAVHNHAIDKEGEAEFDITVDNPTPSVLTVFTPIDTTLPKMVISMLQPSSPKVGMNDIEFTLHKKMGMMDWPATDDFTIEITPEMPSMGHGSPNNVNPTNTGNGHYKGKVNFTMTGEWKINVLIKMNGTAVSQNLSFTTTL